MPNGDGFGHKDTTLHEYADMYEALKKEKYKLQDKIDKLEEENKELKIALKTFKKYTE